MYIWFWPNGESYELEFTSTVVRFIRRLNTESKLVIIWALLIVCGFTLLESNSNAREALLTLARHLKSTSNVSDGWGEGLLGAIGLKKETISNRYASNKKLKYFHKSLIIEKISFGLQAKNRCKMFGLHNFLIIFGKVIVSFNF